MERHSIHATLDCGMWMWMAEPFPLAASEQPTKWRKILRSAFADREMALTKLSNEINSDCAEATEEQIHFQRTWIGPIERRTNIWNSISPRQMESEQIRATASKSSRIDFD